VILLATSGCRPSATNSERTQHLPVMSFEHCGASYIPSGINEGHVFEVSLNLFPSFLRLERVGPYQTLDQHTTIWVSVEPHAELLCSLRITRLQSGPESRLIEERWMLPREDVTVGQDARVFRSDIGITRVQYSGNCNPSSVVFGATDGLKELSDSNATLSGAEKEDVSLVVSKPDGIHGYKVPAGSFVVISESPCESPLFTVE